MFLNLEKNLQLQPTAIINNKKLHDLFTSVCSISEYRLDSQIMYINYPAFRSMISTFCILNKSSAPTNR